MEDLSQDPKVALYSICQQYKKGQENNYENSLELYALLQIILEESELKEEDIKLPNLPEDRGQKQTVIKKFADDVATKLRSYNLDSEDERKLSQLRSHFSTQLGQVFIYEFTDGDLSRIQELINALREHVSSSDVFDESHRRRMLKRLEKLQAELHKKVSDMDHFWGLVGDAGVALGKFGKDAKPFVELIKEIRDIVWRTQARAEQLPSGTESPAQLPESDET